MVIATHEDWDRLLAQLATTGKGPPLTESVVSRVSRELVLPLPSQLERLYLELGNGGFGPYFMPLLTGREHEPKERRPDETEGDWFERSMQAMQSVLGFDMMQREPSSEYPWPHGLLTVADYGCGIHFAVDVLDPHLRVVDCETADLEAGEVVICCEFAYTGGEVPADAQQWYVVTAPSLYAWLERWLVHGSKATRWDWKTRAR